MAFTIVRHLNKDGKVLFEDKNKVLEEIISFLTGEFQREDELDQEVRELLGKHMEEIRKGNLDYQTMYRMIKTRLAKERSIVL
ncbi:MAG: hypothetical protein A2Y56_12275 [Candidatus Aminicenantes bacterium RBG_13_63_10]|nr:MAG: hypothetical protein A2Y56_12275 [Candidatus Aminicenantes bacterium RBG_13_63_10]